MRLKYVRRADGSKVSNVVRGDRARRVEASHPFRGRKQNSLLQLLHTPAGWGHRDTDHALRFRQRSMCAMADGARVQAPRPRDEIDSAGGNGKKEPNYVKIAPRPTQFWSRKAAFTPKKCPGRAKRSSFHIPRYLKTPVTPLQQKSFVIPQSPFLGWNCVPVPKRGVVEKWPYADSSNLHSLAAKSRISNPRRLDQRDG